MFGGGMKAKSLWKYHRLASITYYAMVSVQYFLNGIIERVSGYFLLSMFFYAAHLGGAWSTFTTSHASHFMRLISYSIGLIITLIAVYSRIR